MHSQAVPLGVLRRAVASRATATSQRQVAREIGLSPRGLRKFLDGAKPHTATRVKLERWYVRAALDLPGSIPVTAARAALQVLLGDLPSRRKRAAADRLLDIVEEAHEAEALPIPNWLSALRQH